MPPEINLLRAKTGMTSELAFLAFQLRRIGFLAVTGVLVAGVIVASAYFYLQFSLSTLTNQKHQLILGISANARKETLFRLLKDEIGVAGKVMKSQIQWSSSLDLIGRVVASSELSSITLNNKQELAVTIKSRSVEDAATTIAAIVSEAGQNHLKNPVLQDFLMNADGTIKMSILFVSLI